MSRAPWYPGDRTPRPGPGSKSTTAAVPDFAPPPPIERAPAATASEAGLAEARELTQCNDPGCGVFGGSCRDCERTAAALAERERRVWLRVLAIVEAHIPVSIDACSPSDPALKDVVKAAREATKP